VQRVGRGDGRQRGEQRTRERGEWAERKHRGCVRELSRRLRLGLDPRPNPPPPRPHAHPEPALDTFDIGDVILDKYEVTGILGKGGMGRVLAARDRALDRPVALKFLLPALRDRPDIVSRFEREARTSARLHNAHVASVYAVEKVDGAPFIVMEYLRGRDLSSVIGARGRLPVAEAVDLLLQTCEAVAEAHALGVVHRDLKPGNLFLTETPEGTPILKVLDFGISKTTATDDVSLTAGTAVLGSPAYMSPEQFESARSVDARSDVWSLGVVLYEMLTGAVPFTGDAIPQVWAAILRGSYARLSDRREGIPPALEATLAEALAVDRNKRLPGVEAFAAKLAPFGTDDARSSYARIQRIAARALPVPEAAREAADIDWPVGTGVETMGTASALVKSQPVTRPSARRWVAWSALGVAACAAVGLGLVAPLMAHAPTLAPSASASPTPSSPADTATACDKGDAAACNRLGVRYARGDGVTRDETKAFALYKRACDRKLAVGCVNVGSMLFDGTGVLKDETLGAHMFSQGCEGGAPGGCLNLSVAYAGGRGVPRDAAESVAYAERACSGGALAGCARIAMAKITGEGVAKDVTGGLAQLDAVCKQGETTACDEVIGLHAKGLGADIPADSLRTRRAAAKGCDAGSGTACEVQEALATVDSTGTTAAQANAMFQTNCDKGMLVACAMLGKDLVDGIGTSVDRVKGTALLQRACAGHVAAACEKLAAMGGH
jgi:serine/threonine-protein kinase